MRIQKVHIVEWMCIYIPTPHDTKNPPWGIIHRRVVSQHNLNFLHLIHIFGGFWAWWLRKSSPTRQSTPRVSTKNCLLAQGHENPWNCKVEGRCDVFETLESDICKIYILLWLLCMLRAVVGNVSLSQLQQLPGKQLHKMWQSLCQSVHLHSRVTTNTMQPLQDHKRCFEPNPCKVPNSMAQVLLQVSSLL